MKKVEALHKTLSDEKETRQGVGRELNDLKGPVSASKKLFTKSADSKRR